MKLTEREPAAFPKTIHLFQRYLNWMRLPLKGVSTLFKWTEIMPLSKEHEILIAESHSTIKALSTTFNLPQFFTRYADVHVGIYQAWGNVRKTIKDWAETSLDKLVHSVKNLFFKIIAWAIAIIKLPQTFKKVGLIDLRKISSQLSDQLAKSANLLSLGLTSMKLIDCTWGLGNQLQKDRTSKEGQGQGLSPSAVKSIIKLSSQSLKLISESVTAATLFFGVYFGPVTLAALSSTSFATSLIGKIVQDKSLIWKDKSCKIRDFTHLPA